MDFKELYNDLHSFINLNDYIKIIEDIDRWNNVDLSKYTFEKIVEIKNYRYEKYINLNVLYYFI